ncbi:replication initiator protein A [Methylobacterium sp. WL18]|uniref:replication initiator protein A n=1 Tax=Methylobacterium sp. WL18 TaxID=2603897 RepID=UPI00164EF400|nr:replication initiator protein A [Methylobacterium sp. WL18]
MLLLREPFFALSNKDRVRLSEKGFQFAEEKRGWNMTITTNDPDIGVAQVGDGDILVFAVSKIMEEFNVPGEHTADTLASTIEFYPKELLSAIRRPNVKGGKTLTNLEAGLQRLMNTKISLKTGSVLTDCEFTLLTAYHRGGRRKAGGEPPRWSLTVPRWLLEEIASRDEARVVWFNPKNFDLAGTGGVKSSQLEQLVACWAVGERQYGPGMAVMIRVLRAHKLSGMRGMSKFVKALEKVATLDRLPDHTLKLINRTRADGGDLRIDLRRGKVRKLPAWRTNRPTRRSPEEHRDAIEGDGLPGDVGGSASWT